MSPRPPLTAVLLALVVGVGPQLVAAEPWQAGLASVKITPQQPVRMAGYSSRDKPSEGVAHDLYAKALALQDAEGGRALLITTDLIGFRASLAEPACEKIQQATGLKRQQILLNSSHTHTGPTLSLDGLQFPEDQAAATVAYTKRLQQQLVALAQVALERLEPAQLSWGTGVATFVMNRREATERGVILGVNPRGLADRSVPVLKISAPDGQLRGVVFGAACHNTTLTGRSFQISGDFAGYAQAAIQEHYPDVTAMFMQGCAGDANPYPRGTEELARLHGAALGGEVVRLLESKLQPVAGPLGTQLETVDLPLQQMSRQQIEQLAVGSGGWRRFVSERMLEELDEHGKLAQQYTAPVAFWQFGDDLSLVALPGEVVVDYVTLIERELGPNRLWIAAYCNDVFGYLPSAQVLQGGGYETRGLYSGGAGLFSPQAQDAMVAKVTALARQAGR